MVFKPRFLKNKVPGPSGEVVETQTQEASVFELKQ